MVSQQRIIDYICAVCLRFQTGAFIRSYQTQTGQRSDQVAPVRSVGEADAYPVADGLLSRPLGGLPR